MRIVIEIADKVRKFQCQQANAAFIKQMLTNICKKLESSLSFNYENIVNEGINLSLMKAVHRDEPVLSLAQTDKIYHELN